MLFSVDSFLIPAYLLLPVLRSLYLPRGFSFSTLGLLMLVRSKFTENCLQLQLVAVSGYSWSSFNQVEIPKEQLLHYCLGLLDLFWLVCICLNKVLHSTRFLFRSVLFRSFFFSERRVFMRALFMVESFNSFSDMLPGVLRRSSCSVGLISF